MRSNEGDRKSEVMVVAALISASPVVSWQIDPPFVQWASGNRGEADSCDVMGEDVELRDVVPSLRLRGEHRDDEDFRFDFSTILVSSLVEGPQNGGASSNRYGEERENS